VNSPVDETVELVKSEPVAANEAPTTEVILPSIDVSASTEEQAKQAARKSTSRRGPNRRRPRNPNYKKTEGEGDSNGGDVDSNGGGAGESSAEITAGEVRPTKSRSYNSDFAERQERSERSEPQSPVSATPEPQKSVTESAPKAVEEIKE